MDTIDLIPHDERQLAQLACTKLAKMVKGLLSVGTGACISQWADAKPFISERCEYLRAFSVVLHSVAVKPSAGELPQILRQQTGQIRLLLDQFEQHFLALADSDERSARDVRTAADKLADTFAELCESLQVFAGLIGLEARFEGERDFGKTMTTEIVAAWHQRHTSKTNILA